MLLEELKSSALLARGLGDVSVSAERGRRLRLRRVAVLLGLVAAWLWWRVIGDHPLHPVPPDIPPEYWVPMVLVLLLGAVILLPLVAAGQSPHVRYDPSEISIGFDDVVGATTVREELERTLSLFLAHKTFRDEMGGTPRRAVLFEGPPGTGKTHMAKAIAREAGVPFFFVSSSAFQSMYYGQTNRKLRSYFRALRKAAREEGGAVGFIEEIDAIGGARRGMKSGGMSEGISGVVNEMLIQLQSFDEPPTGVRFRNWFIGRANRLLPPHRRLARRKAPDANVLILGATNRADDLDPALLRPGRFDRIVHFGLPNRAERRELIDYFLRTRVHEPELDLDVRREALAGMTFGYSPVMLEHVLDEALVWALRRGADRLDWTDIQQAKFTEELGLKQPVVYSEAERVRIATHEAGHATVAWLVGEDRKLEVLSIIKRRDALGLLAHSDTDERYTRTRSELLATLQINFGGLAAEELALGDYSTGPAGDLHAATVLAARMVGSLGMGGSLISMDAAEVGNAGNIVAKVLANKSTRDSVDNLLSENRLRTQQLLAENRHVLEALRDALLEREELVGDEILAVIEAAADPVIDLRDEECQPAG
jgi:cell division protease FtsH